MRLRACGCVRLSSYSPCQLTAICTTWGLWGAVGPSNVWGWLYQFPGILSFSFGNLVVHGLSAGNFPPIIDHTGTLIVQEACSKEAGREACVDGDATPRVCVEMYQTEFRCGELASPWATFQGLLRQGHRCPDVIRAARQ